MTTPTEPETINLLFTVRGHISVPLGTRAVLAHQGHICKLLLPNGPILGVWGAFEAGESERNLTYDEMGKLGCSYDYDSVEFTPQHQMKEVSLEAAAELAVDIDVPALEAVTLAPYRVVTFDEVYGVSPMNPDGLATLNQRLATLCGPDEQLLHLVTNERGYVLGAVLRRVDRRR